MLAIWSLVPLPFLNPTCTSGNFLVHVPSPLTVLKPTLKDFEYYLDNMRNEHNCLVVWTSFSTTLWIWDENWTFPGLWPCWAFQICWHNDCSTLTASSFRIWNSSAGIPSPPLDLFVVMLPKAQLTSHHRMSGLGEWPHHRGYPGH